jgi:hypothetical protein
MPVTVHIPAKIRLQRGVLDAHPAWLDEALGAALGRALLSSKKKVLAARGDYLPSVLHPPTFVWKGLAPAAEERAALERRIASLLADLANQYDIGTPAETGPQEVIPPHPSEAFDPARGSALAQVYALDSYEGDQEVLPVDAKHPLLYDYIPVVRVFQEVISDEIKLQLYLLARRATPTHPLGLIYRYVEAGAQHWQVLITDGLADNGKESRVPGVFSFDGFARLAYQGKKANPPFKQVPYVPPPAPGIAEIFDVPGDVAARAALYKRLYGQALADQLRRHDPKPINVTTARFGAAITERVDRHIAEQAARLGNVSKGVKITLGNAMVVVWILAESDRHFRWKGKARLTALEAVETVRKPVSAKGTGAGGGEAGASGQAKTGGTLGAGGSRECPPDEVGLPGGLTGDEGPGTADQPLRGEPALGELGDAGELLAKLMEPIAAALALTRGNHVGQFCWRAANCLNEKAVECQYMMEAATGQNKAGAGKRNNMGAVDFTPGDSNIIARVRELAAVVPMLSQLMATVVDVFLGEFRCSIHGPWRGRGESWALRFLDDVVPMLETAVGSLFVAATRSSLLQLLATSLVEIEQRRKAMPRYAALFEKWILPFVVDLAELELLYELLSAYGPAYGVAKKALEASHAELLADAAGDWRQAGARLVAALQDQPVVRALGLPFDIVTEGGVSKIRGTNGVLWTTADLKSALTLRRGVVEGIDPLVKQITDTPDAIRRFKNTVSIRDELQKLLDEMADNNREMSIKAIRDPMFAFKSSSIAEQIPQATVPGTKYALQGVHLVAHEQIGDAFGNAPYYAKGLDRLFDTEEGFKTFKGVGILTGFVLLSVLVPGFVVFVAGVGLATYEIAGAYEKQRLYKSLIDPDKVLSHADVEVELFIAWFGLVMSLIPEAGTAVKGLAAGWRAFLKGEAKGLGKLAGKALAKRVARELAELAAKDLLAAFVSELALNIVISEIIQKAVEPLAEHIRDEAALRSTSGGLPHEANPEQAAIIELMRSIGVESARRAGGH